METQSTQTIQGSYKMVEMPDGTLVAMHKLSNGEWVTTKERLDRIASAESIMDSFKHTDTIPSPYDPKTEGTLVPKSETDRMVQMVEDAKSSRNRLDAYLGEILGDPAAILSGDQFCKEKIKKVKSRPQELRHVLGLMDVLGAWDVKWQKVRKYMAGVE